MHNKLERLIRAVYKKWKSDHLKPGQEHPDEETWVCFFEDRLPVEENERIKAHLISCEDCAEIFAAGFRLKAYPEKKVPEELISRLKNIVATQNQISILEIILKLKEKALEILSTTGDVLVGQEFIPAPILRSRKIGDFKDQVSILKDFKDIRVEVKIESKGIQALDLTILVKDKQTHRIIKDLRVTLLKDDLELESYLTDLSSITFQNVLAGKYMVQISNIENKIASVILDIKE